MGLADADGATGALVNHPCLSFGSEMVAIWSEQFSPGVCSRPFRGTRRGTGTAGLRKVKGDQSSAENQRLYLSLGQKNVTCF